MKIDAEFAVRFVHRLRFTQDVFDSCNPTLTDLLERPAGKAARLLCFIDAGLAQAVEGLVDRIENYCRAHPEAIFTPRPVQVIRGGESIKNEPQALQPMLRAMDEARLCRRSYVLAIGGGAVLDSVGFAAAMAHRGVRLIRVATTTLAQADSAVGVKNGINAFGKKNYLGVFSPPWAVINDEQLLTSLNQTDWISGFSEAVKVSLLKDADFFAQIERDASRIAARDMAAAGPIIRRSAQLHFEHITAGGDPFELTTARPLDFGHWAAHKLEAMTGYTLSHGHAVAIGMALDLTYGNLMGWFSDEELERVLTCLNRLGFALYHPMMSNSDALLTGLDEFREHLGGELTVPMIRRIGQTFDVHEIQRETMLAAIRERAAAATRPRRTSIESV